MNKHTSHFVFDSRKRSGILLLTLFIVIGFTLYFLVDFNRPQEYDTALDLDVQHVIDSLKAEKLASVLPKIYPFNPNFITDYKGYTLGMSVEEIDRLHRFREKDLWVNSASDFKKVTQVSDSLLAVISPYFKFPDWVTNPKPKSSYVIKKSPAQKKSLNRATVQDLQKIEGVTPEKALTIINYRKRIQGFSEDNQLFEVYGLENKVVYRIKDEFTVKEKPVIQLMDVNTATASDLSTIPYISFDIAKEIVDYRILHEGIKSLDELLKIDKINEYKFNRIRLYLSTSQNKLD